MKKVILALAFFLCLPTLAQEELEDISYSSEQVVTKKFGLPIVRPVYGGTKIIPIFEGNWTNEMKGAFEYACKIWEEAMPTTYPIKIKAILDETSTMYQDKPVYSKVLVKVHPHTGDVIYYPPYTNTSTYTQMMGNYFLNSIGKYNENTYGHLVTPDMVIEPIATIRYYNYNNKLVNNCSFSLDDASDNEHYDFVTMALRDIAKSFGITWSVKSVNGELTWNKERVLPFAQKILDVLPTDSHKAYVLATSGDVKVYGMNLYTPSVWDKDRSLNYFMPGQNIKLAELLSYNFGKGSVVRDIACNHTYSMFEEMLGWKGDIAVSVSSGADCSLIPTSTESKISYKGSISIGNKSRNGKLLQANTSVENITDFSEKLIDPTKDLKGYLLQYHPNYAGGSIKHTGWRVSLLKKDGTWDEVYDLPEGATFEVNTSDFELHNDIEEYARSTDGYLRCRITYATYSVTTKTVNSNAYYYLLDYLPQRVQMAKSAVMPVTDEYLRDVKIGLKNLEGVTRVVVGQLDEDNDLPYYYEVPDFKKGYFIALVDKEFPTEFTITAYNENGTTKSYPYVLPALCPPQINVNFAYSEGNIAVNAFCKGMDDANILSSYEVYPMYSSVVVKEQKQISNMTNVQVSSLPKGHYTLLVYDVKGGKHIYKFVR